MKILIAAGGGGHFSPALSVIEQLPENVEFLLVGRKYALEGDWALSFEYRTAQERNIPFKSLTMGRLQRKFTLRTIPSFFKIPFGFLQAFYIVAKFKPDVTLSFGGYISVPVVVASYILRIPIVVHEQTLGAGLSNKIAGFFARTVCISWESSRDFFPKEKVMLTGNPVKKEFLEGFSKGKLSYKLPLIYITGGTSGSHAINDLVSGCIEELLKKYTVIHQTGDSREFKDYEKLSLLRDTLPEELQKRYILKKFLTPYEIGEICKDAVLVIGRSGMNTVTDLLFTKIKAILIPLPYSQNHEQTKNAEFLKESGLAKILDQGSTTPEILRKTIDEFVQEKVSVKTEYDDLIKNAAAKILQTVL